MAGGLSLGKGCRGCRRPLGRDSYVWVKDQAFHEACVVCGACGRGLAGAVEGELGVEEDGLLCAACVKGRGAGSCRSCRQPLHLQQARLLDFPSRGSGRGERGLVGQAAFHRECLVCELSDCRLLLPLGTVARQGSRLFCSLRCCLVFRRLRSHLPPAPPPSLSALSDPRGAVPLSVPDRSTPASHPSLPPQPRSLPSPSPSSSITHSLRSLRSYRSSTPTSTDH